MRAVFIRTTSELLDTHPRTAVVLADISAEPFVPAAVAHPDRVVNVGIREQLMLSVAGGLALTGLRPYVHSYAPFLVDRAYEQIKLDLDHQGVGAVLVSVGGSYDASAAGWRGHGRRGRADARSGARRDRRARRDGRVHAHAPPVRRCRPTGRRRRG